MSLDTAKQEKMNSLNSLFYSVYLRNRVYALPDGEHIFIVNNQSINDLYANKDPEGEINWIFDDMTVSKMNMTQLNDMYNVMKSWNDRLWLVYGNYINEIQSSETEEEVLNMNIFSNWYQEQT